MAFEVGDSVEVRGKDSQPWQPGVVDSIDSNSYVVVLDTPVPASDFYGSNPSRYAADQDLTTVRVSKASEAAGSPRIQAAV